MERREPQGKSLMAITVFPLSSKLTQDGQDVLMQLQRRVLQTLVHQ